MPRSRKTPAPGEHLPQNFHLPPGIGCRLFRFQCGVVLRRGIRFRRKGCGQSFAFFLRFMQTFKGLRLCCLRAVHDLIDVHCHPPFRQARCARLAAACVGTKNALFVPAEIPQIGTKAGRISPPPRAGPTSRKSHPMASLPHFLAKRFMKKSVKAASSSS